MGRPKGSKNNPKVPTEGVDDLARKSVKKTETETVLIDGVEFSRIKKARNLLGTWHYFADGTMDGFAAADVSDARIAAYLKRSHSERSVIKEFKEKEALDAVKKFRVTEGENLGVIDDKVKDFEEQIRYKVSQYLDDFETPVGMDADNLTNLASAQLRLEELQRLRLFWMAKPIEEQTDKFGRDVLKFLDEAEERLLQQMRLLQKAMGVDLPTRLAKSESVTGVDRVQSIVKEAKLYLQNEIHDVIHCGIRIMWVAPFFPEEGITITTRCPRCKEIINYEECPKSSSEELL